MLGNAEFDHKEREILNEMGWDFQSEAEILGISPLPDTFTAHRYGEHGLENWEAWGAPAQTSCFQRRGCLPFSPSPALWPSPGGKILNSPLLGKGRSEENLGR